MWYGSNQTDLPQDVRQNLISVVSGQEHVLVLKEHVASNGWSLYYNRLNTPNFSPSLSNDVGALQWPSF